MLDVVLGDLTNEVDDSEPSGGRWGVVVVDQEELVVAVAEEVTGEGDVAWVGPAGEEF